MKSLLLFLTSATASVTASLTNKPEQIHIALAGASGLRVTWFTSQESSDPGCVYGSSPTALSNTAKGL